jgi:hypothetical protein
MAIHERNGDRMVYAWRFGLTPAWLDCSDSRFAELLSRLTARLNMRRIYWLPKDDA